MHRLSKNPANPVLALAQVPALVVVLGAALLWVSAAARAGDIFVYQTDDGSRLITDHPRVQSGYRLVKVYSESEVWYQTGQTDRKPRKIKTRPSNFDDLIAGVARQARLDPLLIKSVMHAESAFNPRAVSHKGASGLMQLMPGTAKRYGVSSIFDPHENTLGGALYLSDLLEQFNGKLDLALAGYNAGENAVIERGGIPPYPETRHYVKKVMRLYREYKTEACQQRGNSTLAPDARIISCSGSSPSTNLSSVGPAEPASPEPVSSSDVSSADERQWRPIE